MFKTVIAQDKKQYLVNNIHNFDDYFKISGNFIYYIGNFQDILIAYFIM